MPWVPVVDVSEHQGAINFALMHSKGVKHLIMRASHGKTKDARVTTYYSAALAAGYKPHDIGFYSFINPKRGSGSDTALATAAIIKAVTGRTDVLYMLDVENYAGQSPDVGSSPVTGAAFAAYLRQHIVAFMDAMPGCYVIAYANRSYWNSSLGPNDATLASTLEWLVPRYPVHSDLAYQTKGYPPEPSKWHEWAFKHSTGPNAPTGATWNGWQFSADFNKQGPVYGCSSSALDLNIVDSAYASKWFAAPDTIPPSKEPEMLISHDGLRIFNDVVPQAGKVIKVSSATPAEATGVVLNITFAGAMAPGFAAIWSGEGDAPLISQVNWVAGTTPTNSFTITRIVDGGFSVKPTVDVRLIFDQVGYVLSSPPVAGPPGPPGAPGAPGAPGDKGDKGDPGQNADPQFIIDTVTSALND